MVVFASLGAHSFVVIENARELFSPDAKSSVDWGPL
jgi:hypothetical protein